MSWKTITENNTNNMKKTIITCDKCGKNLDLDNYHNHVKIDLYYWHGGSMGGEEDRDKFDFDLCESCAEKLSNLIDNWLKNKK